MPDIFEKTSRYDFIIYCKNDSGAPLHTLCSKVLGKKLPKFIKQKFFYPGEAPHIQKKLFSCVAISQIQAKNAAR